VEHGYKYAVMHLSLSLEILERHVINR